MGVLHLRCGGIRLVLKRPRHKRRRECTDLGAFVFALFSGIIGMCVVPPADWRVHAFLLLLIVFVTGMHTLVFGHSRYHLPLIPIVLLYSASVCAQARLVWQKRFDWSFRLACGICLLFVAGWIGRTLMSEDMSFLSGL